MVEFAEYMTAYHPPIGRLTMLWSGIHGTIFRLFLGFSRMDPERAAVVFRILSSDSQQRQVTLKMAEVALADDPEGYAAVKAVFDKLNKLAGERNAIIHTPFGLGVKYDAEAKDYVTFEAINPAFNTKRKLPEANVEYLVRVADEVSACSDELVPLWRKYYLDACSPFALDPSVSTAPEGA